MTVAVCAVKNEPNLDAFLVSLRPYVDGVVVADETDGPRWGGIGPSLVWAWREALLLGATQIVQIDAGGSHDPTDIPRLTSFPDTDIVIGSRFQFGSTYMGRPWRNMASRGYGQIQAARRWRTPGVSIRDWTSGYRCFSRTATQHLVGQDYRATMHGWQAEVLHRALDADLSVREAPIRYIAGESSLRPRHIREALAVR